MRANAGDVDWSCLSSQRALLVARLASWLFVEVSTVRRGD
jgi:hypothetical protein